MHVSCFSQEGNDGKDTILACSCEVSLKSLRGDSITSPCHLGLVVLIQSASLTKLMEKEREKAREGERGWEPLDIQPSPSFENQGWGCSRERATGTACGSYPRAKQRELFVSHPCRRVD